MSLGGGILEGVEDIGELVGEGLVEEEIGEGMVGGKSVNRHSTRNLGDLNSPEVSQLKKMRDLYEKSDNK